MFCKVRSWDFHTSFDVSVIFSWLSLCVVEKKLEMDLKNDSNGLALEKVLNSINFIGFIVPHNGKIR